jgi:hypothetical protein
MNVKENNISLYDINNGLVGMKKSINMKLANKINNAQSLRNFMGISSNYPIWKNSPFFMNKHRFPKFFVIDGKNSDLIKISPNIITTNEIRVLAAINDPIEPNTGKYTLKLRIINKDVNFFIIDRKIENYNITIPIKKEFEFYFFDPIPYNTDDIVEFEFDTNKKIIKYSVNNEYKNISYDTDIPLYFVIYIWKNRSIAIESFEFIYQKKF